MNLYFDHFLKEKGLWEDGKKEYVFGEQVKPNNVVVNENKYIRLSEPITNPFAVLKVNRQAPKIWDVNEPDRGSDKGKKVHQILSYIKDVNDLSGAMKKAVREELITSVDQRNPISSRKTIKAPGNDGLFSSAIKGEKRRRNLAF